MTAAGTRAGAVLACHVEDVPLGEGRAITVGGQRIALFHTATGWYAIEATCPHRGGPLADGLVADRLVTCPLHERRFDLATGAGSGCPHAVATFIVEVVGEDVWLAGP